MTTSVEITRTIVMMMPLALTLRAASLVPVMQDSQEMELLVHVCRLNLMMFISVYLVGLNVVISSYNSTKT